ncbi:MAG: VOC family protein [Acidimicrobiales bacterium]
MGVTIDEILVGDPPEAWEAAGYSVDDDGSCRIGQVRVRLVGRDGGKRILGWSLRGAPPARLADGTLDGIPTTAADGAAVDPATHPNGSRYIDHVVLLTPDLARTTAALATIGLTPRGERDSDTYGAPMRQVFFRMGEVILELIGQVDGAGEGAPGFFGIAVTVDDLDGLRTLLDEHLGDAKDAVQDGRRIATLRHKELGMSVATAFMTPEPSPT